jgi:MYXO-CTERM domain-containing protein
MLVSHETMERPLAIGPRLGARRLRSGVVLPLVFLSVILSGPLAPRAARANGAFPESLQLVLPVDRPGQIVLATNFGLIISDDDGATWNWTCEQKATVMGSLYSVSAPPLDRFFSMSTIVGLAYSDDDSCTWTPSGGSLDTALASDYFPDPTNPMRVFAMGSNPNDDTIPPKLFSSDDGGKTFGDAIFTAPMGVSLSGVENARSDPKTIYLATFASVTGGGFHPTLQRSSDGGVTWTPIDVEPSLGPNNFRIVAVDPSDAQVITLRVFEPTGESLAVSRDGGMTFAKVASLQGQFTAYVRLDSGTILVAGALAVDGVGFRSTDGGMTFTDWTPRTLGDGGVPEVAADGGAPRPPHLRALAARGSKLYAGAKNFSDDWAVGLSTDEGVTFTKLTRYDQVSAIRACAVSACENSCESQAAAQLWPVTLCHPAAPPKKGCGCAVSDARGATWGVGFLLAALALGRARRPRR